MKFYLKPALFFFLLLGFGISFTSCGDDDDGGTLPKAAFSFTVNELSVTFTNSSTDAINYAWDFGDGKFSTDASPSHTYAEGGTYKVKLTATNAEGENTTEQDVTVEASSNCETEDNTVSPNISYLWATDSGDATADAFFEGFGMYTTERVENPDQNGNESCYVMKLTRTSGCETWGGCGQVLEGRADFSEHPGVITLDVWGEATDVTLVFENLPHPDNTPLIARTVNMNKSDEWETLTFDFSDDDSGNTYGNLILYINRDTDCNDEVYYVDNLIQE